MQPINEFRGKFRFLSNFYPILINLDGIIYPTAEHAYQASKTDDKGDKEVIATLKTAGMAKRHGRFVKLSPNFERWDAMFLILKIKFANPELRAKLLDTKGRDLIEGNYWNDKFWGVCLKTNSGSNNLGIMLMMIRDSL